jgi:hypothetical protein
MKSGDLLAFSGANFISDLVNVATYGLPRCGISHVAIIGDAEDGRQLLWESTTLDDLPCEITGKRIEGFQAHTVSQAVERYRGKVWLYPLYRDLYEAERNRLTVILSGLIGRSYDSLGACRSAGVGLSWIESLFRDEDLSSIFCSESVAAVYAALGLVPAKNASRWNPNRLVRRYQRAGILLKPDRLK